MAFRKLLTSDVPKRPRKSVTKFERTAEWKQMKEWLDKGLKPNEALEVVLTDEDKNKYRISNRRTVARFIKKYLTDRSLPYKIKSFRRDKGDYFLVMHVPTVRQRRPVV